MRPELARLDIGDAFSCGPHQVAEQPGAFPGVGRYLIQAVNNRDFPAVQSGVLFVSLTFVTVNFLGDALYATIDPRIRYD